MKFRGFVMISLSSFRGYFQLEGLLEVIRSKILTETMDQNS